ARIWGPMIIVYFPWVTCLVNSTRRVRLLTQVKPVICGLRSTPLGPVKLTTSVVTEKLVVFIASLKTKSIDRGAIRVVPEGCCRMTIGSDGGRSKASVIVGESALGPQSALTPRPRRANACQIKS